MSRKLTAFGVSALLCCSAGLVHTSKAADVQRATAPMAEQRVETPDGNTVSVWTDVSRIWTEDKRPLTRSRAQVWQNTTGIDYAFGRSLSVGAGFSVSRSRVTEFAVPGQTETDTAIGFARATAYFMNVFNANIIAGYGRAFTDGSRVFSDTPERYSRDADVKFLGLSLGAFLQNQNFFVAPSMRLLFSDTGNNPFLTSLAIAGPRSRDDYTRASFGGDLGYRFAVGDAVVTPALRAFLLYDLELPNGYRDRTALDLSLMLNVQSGRLNAGIEALTTLGRADYENYALRGYAYYRF